jgi:hypothetical protein
VLFIDLWGNVNENVNEDPSDLDESHVFFVLNASLHESVGCVNDSDVSSFFSVNDARQ